MGCTQCGEGKKRTTHTFGTYRAYKTNTTLVLRCKTCGHTVKFRIIQGGYVENPKNKETYDDDIMEQ